MLEMLRAHGLQAGPTQRPLYAGTLAGVLAEAPALFVLYRFDVLDVLASAGHGSALRWGLLHAVAMAFGGAAYGLLFQRAANDQAGGWLFGMAYGFLLWMIAAVPLLQWLPPEPLLRGDPALALFTGQLLWGLATGLCFPHVHAPLKAGVVGRAASDWIERVGWR
jgi:hypothetical protein